MIAYFDCFSGISGDMTLGALIDLGVPVEWLRESISSIPLNDFDLEVFDVKKNGISAKDVHVHELGHNHTNSDEHSHSHSEDHHHSHEKHHHHEHEKKHGTSRDYKTITSLIKNSPLSGYVKELSLEIFENIAAAESEIHKRQKEDVHFHEVGGVDAIVDIVGTALCIEYLGINTIFASKIPLGTGFVNCDHGKIPVPSPATISILKNVPVYGTETPFELVTPTGAAIIKTLSSSFGAMPDMIVQKTGYGAGKRDTGPTPNLLRVITGNTAVSHKDISGVYDKESAVIVETCIDDMNPEIFGFLMERLLEDGALDVYWIPIFMKKNRPGTMVQVLCGQDKKDAVINRLLSETTSIGARYYNVLRDTLPRELIQVETSYGTIKAKCIKDPVRGSRITPEYEECKKIAIEKNIPIKVVYETILKEISK